MKINLDEFLQRQEEFKGYKVKFTTKWKNGKIKTFERLINDRFCTPNGNYFQITEIEILEHIGITNIEIKKGKMFLKIAK